MTIDEMISVLEAYKAGKTIEFRLKGSNGSWLSLDDVAPEWQFQTMDYRVKPKPREVGVEFNDSGRPVCTHLIKPTRTPIVKFREVLDNE